MRKQLIAAVKQNRSILLTGGAGVGKSYSTRLIAQMLKDSNKRVAILGSTGIASGNIGGMTSDSFFGNGVWDNQLEFRGSTRFGSKYFMQNNFQMILNTDVIFIDECSMISREKFELYDWISRAVEYKYLETYQVKRIAEQGIFGKKTKTELRKPRNHELPFAGKQVILVGDFLQLKPVCKNKPKGYSYWLFESKVFADMNFHIENLVKVYRQKDLYFSEALNTLRMGLFTKHVEEVLMKCSDRKLVTRPVSIVGTNKEIDELNQVEIDKIDEKEVSFLANIYASGTYYHQIIENTIVPSDLVLKKSARVMILKNGYYCMEFLNLLEDEIIPEDMKHTEAEEIFNRSYYNGSLGTFVRFDKATGHNGKYEVDDLECAIIRLDETEFSDSKLIRVFIQEVANIYNPDFVPEYDHNDKVTNENDKYHAQMYQIPIRPAYALTVHKSQGLTLQCIEVDFKKFFTDAQVYVACSRATTLEGLRILNYNPRKIRADRIATGFYKYL